MNIFRKFHNMVNFSPTERRANFFEYLIVYSPLPNRVKCFFGQHRMEYLQDRELTCRCGSTRTDGLPEEIYNEIKNELHTSKRTKK